MKKIFAIALALMLVMSMGTTAFAADYVGEAALDAADSSTSFYINGKIVENNEDVSVIAVDVSYGAMRFVFSKNSSGLLWNPNTHAYDGESTSTSGAAWIAENDSNYVTITNHSNVDVSVKLDATTGITYDSDGGTNEYDGLLEIIITNVADVNNVSAYVPNAVDGDASIATYSTEWFDVESAVDTDKDDAPNVMYSVEDDGVPYNDPISFNNFDSTEFTLIGTVTVSIKEADQTV